MAEKQTNKERLKDITDSIETGIKELFESDKYRQYLATMSRFHKYSVNNTMLIYMQRPDATHVAGFNKWRDQFGRSVKKGEKGIKIIAPTPFKKKIEQQKLDPDTKLLLRDENGDIITEEKTVQIPMYRPVVVFDVQNYGCSWKLCAAARPSPSSLRSWRRIWTDTSPWTNSALSSEKA